MSKDLGYTGYRNRGIKVPGPSTIWSRFVSLYPSGTVFLSVFVRVGDVFVFNCRMVGIIKLVFNDITIIELN